ncbi:hypothetical protein MKX07_000469 [Trichoderma sp. CBMAI-0711]|uniref:Predicted protein n=3 Tax=Trichoderma TaxID=5543 RepID=G0RH06_HYPJQ|nr:uncharacterized protein TRIREDRAFT_106662 [Trichoderma reesei QM6a]EGR49453.1 predicted protein [Trichoderma reesei QM6a]ETS02745.1 hypothetical protein M419DRAFT_7538 [Trichoderma reesei RUT C-30]KAK1237047.1 hypothetical protein MKX07_000469 [Trichoderma sp. CBMAI-0711]OTA00078.1 SSCRP protein [Trichoderma parareesei]
MLFSRDFIPTILALALSATRVEATIAVGTAAGFNVMWVDGADPCRWTRINDQGENPCGVHLANPLDNGHKYVLQGCGGPIWLDNDDGSFNSNCHDAPANLACNVHRSLLCY